MESWILGIIRGLYLSRELDSRSRQLGSPGGELESRTQELDSRNEKLESRTGELRSRSRQLSSPGRELDSRNHSGTLTVELGKFPNGSAGPPFRPEKFLAESENPESQQGSLLNLWGLTRGRYRRYPEHCVWVGPMFPAELARPSLCSSSRANCA